MCSTDNPHLIKVLKVTCFPHANAIACSPGIIVQRHHVWRELLSSYIYLFSYSSVGTFSFQKLLHLKGAPPHPPPPYWMMLSEQKWQLCSALFTLFGVVRMWSSSYSDWWEAADHRVINQPGRANISTERQRGGGGWEPPHLQSESATYLSWHGLWLPAPLLHPHFHPLLETNEWIMNAGDKNRAWNQLWLILKLIKTFVVRPPSLIHKVPTALGTGNNRHAGSVGGLKVPSWISLHLLPPWPDPRKVGKVVTVSWNTFNRKHFNNATF